MRKLFILWFSLIWTAFITPAFASLDIHTPTTSEPMLFAKVYFLPDWRHDSVSFGEDNNKPCTEICQNVSASDCAYGLTETYINDCGKTCVRCQECVGCEAQGYRLSACPTNGICSNDCCNKLYKLTDCKEGFTKDGDSCREESCTENASICTGGKTCQSGVCKCPSGKTDVNGTCETSTCTNGGVTCSGSVCDTSSGKCVECLSKSDCSSGVCDTSSKTCVGCLSNSDCSGGKECNANHQCIVPDACANVTCSGGKSCVDGTCICPSGTKDYGSGTCEAPNCTNGGVTCSGGQTCNQSTKICEDSAKIIPCKVGDTLYSDIHCYDGVPTDKEAIATVFDTQKGLAAALVRRELKWFNGTTNMTSTDVSLLDNCSSSVDKTQCSTDGKSNTIKIMNHGGSSKSSYEAAYYCYSYTTKGTQAGDWFLPSAAEMDKIITNLEAFGQYWDDYWTSTEMNGVYAWEITEYSVGGVPQGTTYISTGSKTSKNFVRPVIAYNDLTPVEPDCTNGGIICAADEKCNEQTGLCEIDYAEILYSDKTTSVDPVSGKTAIGVVVDKSRRLAVALTSASYRWEEGEPADVISGKTKLTNIPSLADIDSSQTTTAFGGKANTQIIVNSCSNCSAASYAYNYTTAGTSVGQWYLPASGELWLMYQRKAAINRTMSRLGKSAVLASGYAWSSSESAQTNAGNMTGTNSWIEIPTAWGLNASGNFATISKHLYHNVYPMITY